MKNPGEKRFLLWKAMQGESWAWRSVMLQTAIIEFANEVARKLPPGTKVQFDHQPPGSPGCKPPAPRRCEGVVAKNQCFPGEMCSEGLLVEVSPDVFAETSLTRRFEKVGNNLILLHWCQILL